MEHDGAGAARAPPPPAAAKATRQPLTLAEKNELRRFYAAQQGATKHGELLEWVRAKFGKSIGRSSIGRILSSDVDAEEATMGAARIRKRSSKYPDIEAALLTFILENRERGALTDDVLWDHARAAAAGRQVSMSWVQRFKSRNGLKVKSRSLLSNGQSLDGEEDAARAAYISALTKRRDELLGLGASAKDEVVEEVDNSVGADATEDDDGFDDETAKRQPQSQPKPVQQPAAAKPAAPRETPPLHTPTKPRDAAPAQPTKSSPGATSPRFTIVSQSTGRVELENRSEQKKNLRKPRAAVTAAKLPPTPPVKQAAPVAVVATPSPAPKLVPVAASPARSTPSKRVRSESEDTSTSAAAGGSEQGTPSKHMMTALESREIELRVEGLRTDNLLKRIKVAEENMLARKRLKDAGIAQEEIDALLPIVRIQDLQSARERANSYVDI